MNAIKQRQMNFRKSKVMKQPVFTEEEEKIVDPEMNQIMNRIRTISQTVQLEEQVDEAQKMERIEEIYKELGDIKRRISGTGHELAKKEETEERPMTIKERKLFYE